jgi:hypothetical protein
MAAGLVSRIGRIEKLIGTDDGPRTVRIFHGPCYAESWIERGKGWDGRDVELHVKAPDDDSSPFDHLTPEQRREIRPGDAVIAFETVPDGRDSQLQCERPPWKRRPYRLSPDGRYYELQDEWGVWRRHEFP